MATENGKWVLCADDYGGAAPVLLEGSTPLRLRRNDEVALCSATCERIGPRLVLTLASRFSITNKGDEALDIRCVGSRALYTDQTTHLPLVSGTTQVKRLDLTELDRLRPRRREQCSDQVEGAYVEAALTNLYQGRR